MKTNMFISIGLLMLLTNASFAQSSVQSETLDNDVDAQIDQLYRPASRQQQQPSVVTQTVYVPQQQSAVQKQPVTVVEASPLSDSRADNIRRNRQDEEMKTESKIVEKLEQSRMEDEKRRAAVLFGDKFDNLENRQNQQPEPVTVSPVQAPPSQIQPQPIIIQQAAQEEIPKDETLTRDAVREEVRAALDDEENAVTPVMEQKYFAGIAGIGQYPDSDTIKGNYALGAAFGSRYDLFLVEGAFIASNYTVAGLANTYYGGYIYPQTFTDFYSMNQYQGLVSAKYQLLAGFVRPYLGGLISYSYRSYESNYDRRNLNGTITKKGNVDVTSQALDLATDVGVDLEFNSRTSFGASFKYFFNMASSIKGDTAGGGTALEKQSYYQAGLHARVNF
jgi:hypothetical protein